MTILGVSGSLRAESRNTRLLREAQALGPVALFEGLDALPHFSPGRDEEQPSVRAWRDALATSDAVLISSPEYAHGVPGALKNALDWIVGTGELSGKPVAVVSVSALSKHAPEQLREILTTMDARVVEVSVVLPGDEEALRGVLARLTRAARTQNEPLRKTGLHPEAP